MMLRWSFGLEREADAVEAAVDAVLADGYRCGDIKTPGCKLVGTVEMGDAVVSISVGESDIDNLAAHALRLSLLPKLSQEFTTIMKEDGVSLADMLQGLEQERDEIWRERPAGHA